ncbi:ABC transporter substrate-binding protein [Pusillimonas sp.]|uniref:ABC transporter substrate-binding protein n=1 Tax=Pusillimonas sp. TaxID=3040095 RepID=UPI0037CA3D2B
MHHKAFSSLAAIMAAFLLLTALGSFQSAHAQEKLTIRIGIQPNILPEAILRANQTLEQKYGDVYEIRWVDTTHAGAAIEAMVAGSIDITNAAALPLILAHAQGLDIWGVADSIGDVSGIVVGKDSGIDSVADLAGKTLAYPGRGSLQQALIEAALEEGGVASSEVRLVRARFPEMPLLLQREAVDGFSGTEPFISMLLSQGEGKLLYRLSDKLQQKENTMIIGQIGVRGEFARQHPDALRAVLAEFQEASRFVRSNPKEAAKVFAAVFPTVVDEKSFTYALEHGLVYFEDVQPNKDQWIKFLEFSNKAGLTEIADPDAFLDSYLHPEFL